MMIYAVRKLNNFSKKILFIHKILAYSSDQNNKSQDNKKKKKKKKADQKAMQSYLLKFYINI